MHILIMAGGQGTRFWPESTTDKPKQYLNLLGEKTLIETTYERMLPLSEKKNISIITVKNQIPLVEKSLGQTNLIVEPLGKNTAPCLLLALATLLKNGAKNDDVMAVVPSDHVILDIKGFHQTMRIAESIARDKNKIVTIGIKPHFPHTGFGYIKISNEILKNEVFEVESFKEKPNFDTATKYLQDGGYYWNAGIFVTRVDTLREEFKNLAPYYYEKLDNLKNAIGNEKEVSEIYNQLKADSIDYALMEKSKRVALVKAQFDWNDLGSWDALEQVLNKKDDNIVAGAKEFAQIESKDNIVYAPNQKVAIAHVNNMIIVSIDGTLMILPKDQAQKVKDLSLIFNELQIKKSNK